MKRSAQPLPSGERTNAEELSRPRKANSFWKWSDMYCETWSWRTARPWAIALANPPKYCRTPWRIDSRAWKRVARAAYCRPGLRVDEREPGLLPDFRDGTRA